MKLPRRPRNALPSLLVCTFAVAAPAGAAAAVQTAPEPSNVERLNQAVDEERATALVAQLADPSWKARQDAQEQLVAMGPAALPVLTRSRAASQDVQVHAALDLIEGEIALSLAHTGRPIFARFHATEAAAAVREMADQAGIALQIDERRLQGVKIDGEIDGLRFWPAMVELCARHDLDVRPVDSGLRITRATEGAMRTLGGPMSTHGPMLILARGAHYERKLSLDRAPAAGSLIGDEPAGAADTRFRYEFEALLESRFAAGTRRFTVLLTHAADDAGNVLIGTGAADGHDLGRELGDPAAARGGELALAASMAEAEWAAGRLRFNVDLRYPSSPGRRMNLAGRVRGLAGADVFEATAAAAELTNGVTWHAAGERVEVRLEPSAAAGRWTLTLETARAVVPEVADLLAAGLTTAELRDAAGDTFRRGAIDTDTGDDGRLSCRLEFIGPVDETMLPRQLTCRLPRRAIELDIPFAFENLPMP